MTLNELNQIEKILCEVDTQRRKAAVSYRDYLREKYNDDWFRNKINEDEEIQLQQIEQKERDAREAHLIFKNHDWR